MSDPEDPFDGITFDDAWVAASSTVEPSARVRANRVAFEALDIAAIEDARSQERRATRQRRLRRLAAVVLVASITPLTFTLLRRNPEPQAMGRLGGIPIHRSASVGDVPPPTPGESSEPLGTPPEVEDDDRYAFMGEQRDGSPVRWDPCRTIHLVVNDRTMPDGGDALLDDALEEISTATGLQFDVDGSTDEEASVDRASYQRDRYGRRWAPVLVAWTDPDEVEDLEGQVAGIGGPNSIAVDGGPAWWVSGIVLLDGPQIDEILDRDDRATAVAVISHELGHLVGLAHSDDPSQLMYAEGNEDNEQLGPGDRAGLARLGGGTCAGAL